MVIARHRRPAIYTLLILDRAHVIHVVSLQGGSHLDYLQSPLLLRCPVFDAILSGFTVDLFQGSVEVLGDVCRSGSCPRGNLLHHCAQVLKRDLHDRCRLLPRDSDGEVFAHPHIKSDEVHNQ